MMMRGPLTTLFAILILLYIGWIAFAPTPTVRIERGCQPIEWAGNLTVSLTAFMNPSWEKGVQHFFDRSDYVCRYSVWRVIYGKDWTKSHPQDGPGAPDVGP